MSRILVTARAFMRGGVELAEDMRKQGHEVVFAEIEAALAGAELVQALEGFEAIIAGNDKLTAEVLEQCPRLKVISRWGVGYDAVDVEAATRRGIVVTNTPGLLGDAVADLVFAFMLALARKILPADRTVRSGGWAEIQGVSVNHKTLGIIGLGSIGKCVARRAKGFEMTVLASDPLADKASAEGFGVELVSLSELLQRSDFVSLNASLSASGPPLLGEAELRQMKPSALLINTARGALVDEDALVRALNEGWIAGAALDVYAHEPPRSDHPLFELDNCLFTPHIGFNDAETVRTVSAVAAENAMKALAGERPKFVVNPAVYRE